MNDTLKGTIDHIIDVAMENLMRDGNLTPVGFFIMGGEVCGIVSLPFDTPEMKYAAMVALGQVAEKHSADAVIVVSDVWVSTRTMEANDWPIPSEDPAHQEAIVLACKEKDGSTHVLMTRYVRNDDNKVVSFEERMVAEENNCYLSLLEEVFPQHRSTH